MPARWAALDHAIAHPHRRHVGRPVSDLRDLVTQSQPDEDPRIHQRFDETEVVEDGRAGGEQGAAAVEREIGIEPVGEFLHSKGQNLSRTTQQAARGEYRIAEHLGDQQVAASRRLGIEAREIPGGESRGGDHEEHRQRRGEANLEGASDPLERPAPPRTLQSDRGEEPDDDHHRRIEQNEQRPPHGQRKRRVQGDRCMGVSHRAEEGQRRARCEPPSQPAANRPGPAHQPRLHREG